MGAGVSAATPPQTLRQAILGTRNPGGEGAAGFSAVGRCCRRRGWSWCGWGAARTQPDGGLGDLGRGDRWGRGLLRPPSVGRGLAKEGLFSKFFLSNTRFIFLVCAS